MNRKLQVVIFAAVASVLALPALAQDSPFKAGWPDHDSRRWHRPQPNRLNGAAKASDIIGMTVQNSRNRNIGKVEDIVVDVESGRIVQVILFTGMRIPMGRPSLAVSPEDLHHDVARNVLELDADRDDRRGAPNVSRPRPDQGETVSKIMGMSVKNRQDERLGKVENILVDLPSGRIVAVIVSSRGFHGRGNELRAVPPTALRFNHKRDILQLDASRETFRNRPHFRAEQWPDFSRSSYSGEVYRTYKVEPYFTIETTTEVVRERDNRPVTPFDQGNTQADANISAAIRKEIFADRGMSMNARNVKIITINGRVTLYGPVNTAEEKRRIGEIADRVAHSRSVDNQLEVRFTSFGHN